MREPIIGPRASFIPPPVQPKVIAALVLNQSRPAVGTGFRILPPRVGDGDIKVVEDGISDPLRQHVELPADDKVRREPVEHKVEVS